MRAHLSRRGAIFGALACGTVPGAGRARAADAQVEDPWPALAAQIFGGRGITDGSGVIGLDAPLRAEDAAAVPVTINILLAPEDVRRVRRMTLVIDENPVPLAATFTPGPNSGIRTISTRVRVDAYTNIHVVAEMQDGTLAGTHRFVKATGGCSAPAPRLTADAIPLGTMRFRQFPPTDDARGLRTGRLMIRHPNDTGMQMDQLTRLYVPARFVSRVRLWQGDDLLIEIEGGISIAEDPDFRFNFRPNGAARFRAEAVDSRNNLYKAEWAADGTSS
jgi:sulfur-oxidizing protein SoxY